MLNRTFPERTRVARERQPLNRRPSSPVRFPFCRLLSRGDCIVDLRDDDPSRGDGGDFPAGRWHMGSIVCLDLPLIGWRNARVVWIQSGQACCRLLVPLTESELRATIAESQVIPPRFPSLVDDKAPPPRRPEHDAPLEILRIPTGPLLLQAPQAGDRIDLMVIVSLALVVVTWVVLYVMPF
jgi:hypothetical protein